MLKSLWNGILVLLGKKDPPIKYDREFLERYSPKRLNKFREDALKIKEGAAKEINRAATELSKCFVLPEIPHRIARPDGIGGVIDDWRVYGKRPLEVDVEDNEIVFVEKAHGKEAVAAYEKLLGPIERQKDAKAERPIFKCK